jgi:tetraacyldisaccharide 4'-kinase
MYFAWRGFRDRRYFNHFPERFGRLPARSDAAASERAAFQWTASGAIWLHAVSVGEVISSVALLRHLRDRLPFAPLYVSTTTVSGRAVAEEKLAGLVAGIFYAPVDYCFAVRQVLRTIRPQLVVVLETEIWPNLYREAKRFGCGLVVVNARIGDRAFPRYMAARTFFKTVLEWPDVILAQSARMAGRYIALGASPERTIDAGNLKYDYDISAAPSPASVVKFVKASGAETVWIAASTMPPREAGDIDEDDAIIEVFKRLAERHRSMLLILAPRRPERFDAAAAKLASAGISFARRSSISDGERVSLPGVLLLDSIGELASLFAFGQVVFMGGTLAKRGGHNVLEPAFSGRPVIAGPHMENFAEIAEDLTRERALFRVQDVLGLREALELFLADEELRQNYGERGRVLAQARRGVTQRAAAEIQRLYEQSVPCKVPPAFLLLRMLSLLWAAGSRAKQRRALAARQRLNTPVISVGGIAMGGTGKTPLVLWLAQAMKARGFSPAILTRGYGRRSPDTILVYGPGEAASPRLTGDEPQIFLRHGVAPVGISGNRFKAGRVVEERFHPDVMLLDDGFQHRRLDRTLDMVVIDALDALAGCRLFPAGRLREPVEALSRAGAFVLSRAEPARTYAGLLNILARYSPSAPVFRSRVVPEKWFELGTSQECDPRQLPFQRVGAFCGLANPEAFWRTLSSLGIDLAGRWVFPDHHRYRPAELMRIRDQCRHDRIEALLTTEKDIMNLPARPAESLAGLPVWWLRIGTEVENADELLDWIEGHLSV